MSRASQGPAARWHRNEQSGAIVAARTILGRNVSCLTHAAPNGCGIAHAGGQKSRPDHDADIPMDRIPNQHNGADGGLRHRRTPTRKVRSAICGTTACPTPKAGQCRAASRGLPVGTGRRPDVLHGELAQGSTYRHRARVGPAGDEPCCAARLLEQS